MALMGKIIKICGLKKSIFFFLKFDVVLSRFHYSISKEYRDDLNLWEESKYIFWFIPYYKYSIFKDGKLHIKKTLFIKNKETKKYSKCVPLPPIKVGKKEFEEKYKSNKWAVPINYELDLDTY